MLKIKETIVVEGLHDKIKLEQLVDATIIQTNGTAIFGDKPKIAMLKRLAEQNGLIILTDSDAAGFRIRSYIKSCIGEASIKHAYIPQIEGKERRKAQRGAEGLLGVEGMQSSLLCDILVKAGCSVDTRSDANGSARRVEKSNLYEDGLLGGPNSAALRRKFARKLQLPPRISATALLDVINSLYSYDEYKALLHNYKS